MNQEKIALLAPPPRRPHLPVNRDNAFWIEGVRKGQLLVQRCDGCGVIRYPPAPMCGQCQSLEWTAVQLSGRGVIYSYVVHHKPPLAGFTPPYVVLLVELEEGVRMLGNLVDAPVEAAKIGLPVQVVFRADPGDDYVLPQWRPVEAA